MLRINQAGSFRRTTTGVALIVAPLAVLAWVSLSLGIDYGDDTDELLAAIGESPGRERASALTFLTKTAGASGSDR